MSAAFSEDTKNVGHSGAQCVGDVESKNQLQKMIYICLSVPST